MTEQVDARTPEERAEAVARDLADRGVAVTARAVREAAGVRMAVAAEAARAWREATAAEDREPVPEVPEDVQGRLAAIWADAYRAAVAVVSPERDRLAAEVEALGGEVEALTVAVGEVEAESDVQAARADAAESERATAVAEREAQAARADRAEDRVSGLDAERDRLAEQVAALIARIPEAQPEKERKGRAKPSTS